MIFNSTTVAIRSNKGCDSNSFQPGLIDSRQLNFWKPLFFNFIADYPYNQEECLCILAFVDWKLICTNQFFLTFFWLFTH